MLLLFLFLTYGVKFLPTLAQILIPNMRLFFSNRFGIWAMTRAFKEPKILRIGMSQPPCLFEPQITHRGRPVRREDQNTHLTTSFCQLHAPPQKIVSPWMYHLWCFESEIVIFTHGMFFFKIRRWQIMCSHQRPNGVCYSITVFFLCAIKQRLQCLYSFPICKTSCTGCHLIVLTV